MGGFFLKVGKVIQATYPVAFPAQVALMTSLAGCLKQTVVWTVPLINYLENQQLVAA